MLPILQNQSVTMSSREIADLTGKNHFDVKRDIQNTLLQADIDASKFAVIYKDSQNRNQSEYKLPKRECDLVVSGYSVKYRLAIIDRWQELERQERENKQPENPLIQLANAVITAQAIIQDQSQKLLIAEPKAAALDLISSSNDSRCIRDTAKELKLKPSILTKYLIENRWIYRQSCDNGKLGKIMAYQQRIDQGLIEHCSVVIEQKGQSKLATNVKITGKGFARLATTFANSNLKA